jgi:tetratricopeptide (TPR) repeat protein
MNHAAHVKLGWEYLQRYPLPEAIARFREALQCFAAANGATDKYHETITWAYLLLIHERMQRTGDGAADFDAFAAANPDLFDWNDSVLSRYYRADTLASDLARRVFVFPDGAQNDPDTAKPVADPST